MQAEMKEQTQQHQVSIVGIFRDKRLRSALWLCLVAMVARQFSGYTVIVNYSTAIFTGVGLNRQGALLATLGLWGVSLNGTLLSLFLVDRAGRKTLLLTCEAGLVVSMSIFITFAALKKEGYTWTEYGSVACFFAILLFNQTGLASIAYILPAELFGQEARCAAISVATGVAALCAVCTTFLFPVLEALIEEYTYIIFIGVLVAAAAFSAVKLPETKGKTIAEIH
ncbi:hypothetical protein RvY_03903 [Ramazzottius varieornatus]|uniref:Major facilitator superfamily (MFS) profile domain-containing protein n=1 Tax=Ramazzottius varieornatus TaxID=947166 RepID=A0A1D1UPQ7_RAMVA|nr:hypothetical protein RvY_03903 [Ramazzottius varieornatus]